MSPYDNANDPFYMVESRIRQLKYKLNGTIESIGEKYGERGRELSREEKELTIGRMKDYIEEKQIDYLR